MNKSRKVFSLAEAKIQASLLLKSFRSNDMKAAKRFKRLPEFSLLSVEDILKQSIKHKHALTVVAIEHSFKSWTDLKIQTSFIIGGHLNLWFADYQEAKSHLQAEGGFLLSYKNQFFICDASYLQRIGFDPNDPDWKLIGYDWSHPDNKQAWQRLFKKWSNNQTKI